MNPLVYSYILMTVIVSSVFSEDVNHVQCGGTVPKGRGILEVKSEANLSQPCAFFVPLDAPPIFAIKTDNLKLTADDSVCIKSTKDDHGSDCIPVEQPFDLGYVLTNMDGPELRFTFKKPSGPVMYLEYIVDANFPINGDVRNDFTIAPIPKNIIFNMNLTRSGPDPINLEFEGAHFADGNLKHKLIKEDEKVEPIQVEQEQKVHVRSSPAYSSCSGYYLDKDETPHTLVGPQAKTYNRPYSCVNYFQGAAGGQSHYEVDLKEFVDFTDSDDKLTIDDGTPKHRVELVRSNIKDSKNKIFQFQGNFLVVTYNSPRVVKPNDSPFKLTVQLKNYGGIVAKDTKLSLPPTGLVRFSVEPDDGEFAAIELPENIDPKQISFVVSKGGEVFANLTGVSTLPPVVAMDQTDIPLSVELSGSSLKLLNGLITSKSLEQSCHQVANPSGGSFSISGTSGPCYLTMPSYDETAIRIAYNDLLPDGCLTIRSMSGDGILFKRCNISSAETLPNFIIGRAYLNVSLPSPSTRFDSSFIKSQNSYFVKLEPSDTVDISSLGYPYSYDWSSSDQIYSLNGTGKSYVLSAMNVDIRDKEKLKIGSEIELDNRSKILLGDIDISSKETNITIHRVKSNSDFAFHEGFKLRATRFSQILSVDGASGPTRIPSNLTSVYVKISSQSKTVGKFGKRISFNITTLPRSQDYDLALVDSRTLLGRSLVMDDKSTTSDTLIVTIKVKKAGVKLPLITIDHHTLECNTTIDHVCDSSTRCVPADKLCKGVQYCDDGTDIKLRCSSGPLPNPPIIERGLSGISAFILCVLMLTIGAVGAIYGPDLIRNLDGRFRSGHYTTFTSSE